MADDIKFVIGVDDRDLIKAQKEQLKFQRNLLSIETAYRKGDITAKRYNAELAKQTRELQKLGGSYNKASSEVRKFAYQLRTADDAALASSQKYAFAGKNVNRMGMQMQQAGYQIGDFAVQIQGGTNAAVALGQQGAQLLGIFGPAGAIAGAALAITTAFIAPMLKAKKSTEEATDALEKYQEIIKNLRSGVTSEERSLIGDITEANKDLKEANAALKLRQAMIKRQNEDVEHFSKMEKGNVDTAQEALDVARKRLTIFRDTRKESERLQTLSKRNLSVVNQLAEARRIIADNQKKVSKEQYSLAFDILLTNIKIGEIGTKGVLTQELIKQKTLEQYDADWRRMGLSQTIVDSLVNQKSQAMALAEQLERAEAADERRSKIKFSNLGMSDAMLALQYQEMGQSRANAPKEPPKAKKTSGAKESPQEKLAKYIEGKKQEQVLEKQLVGVLGEERQIQTELFNIKNQYAGVITPQQEKELENTLRLTQAERDRQAVVEEAASQQEQLANFIGDSMENAMMGIVDGTVSVKDAFKSMASEIIKELYRVLVVQQMVNAAKGFFGLTAADGAVVSGGSEVKAYANGGVVSGPTTFPMAGGKTGLMGEAGPEAIMPLKRGSNGKLGVQMEGGGGGDVININQSFNFQANGDDSVKKLIAQAAPKIADMAKASVIDSRRRGGSTKAAFG